MKKILLLFFVLSYTVSTWATRRSAEEAFDIACSFFAQHAATRSTTDVRLVAMSGDLLCSVVTRNLSADPSFYIYNQGEDAYVIVSGDDRMKPVLGYSDHGAFAIANLPQNIQVWLAGYDAMYTALNEGKRSSKEPRLLTRTAFPNSVAPLLKDINWNQDAPYNNACPLVGGSRCMTGCVATAMAMVMKYHNYPVKGKGSHTYKLSSGDECSFDFENTTFAWDQMLPQYAGNYTKEQADAVAELMYACGVALDMQYGVNASGAYSHQIGQALIDYFGYDEGVGYVTREYFTSEEWMNMIKTELSEGRPVCYNGVSKDVGHAFVFDGYDAQDMVHVNWGWGGANNGYFEVASLDPSNPGIGGGTNLGGGFVLQQGMTLGIQKPTALPKYTSHFSLEALTADKEKVTKEEKFSLSAERVINMTTTFLSGSLGVIVEKDGKCSVLWSANLANNIKTYSGYGTLTCSNVVIPKDLANGTYALYLATKDNRETEWSRVRGAYGVEAQFTLVVAGNDCTLTPFAGTLDLERHLTGSVELMHNLYSGRRGDFKMTLSNRSASNEFYGLAGVVFLALDDNEEYQFVSLAGYTQLELKAGTVNREFLISGDLTTNLQENETNIAAGDYFICPGVQWGGYIYALGEELLPVTVKLAYGNPELDVADASLEKDKIEVGEKLKLKAKLSLTGTGNVYDKTLMAAIFPASGGSTSNLHYADVFVEKGETLDWEMLIDPQVGEGDYFVALYKPDLLGQYDGNNPLCRLNFSVGPFTAIEEERAEQAGVRIYQHPAEEVLRVCTDSEVYMISLYNLAGQQVICNQVSESGREYSVPVDGLSSGCYIVSVRLADGTVHRSKFIKR